MRRPWREERKPQGDIPPSPLSMWKGRGDDQFQTNLPEPATVKRPLTKSTGSEGTLSGLHLSWLGVTAASSKLLLMVSAGNSRGWNGSWVTEGRMR